MGNADTSQTGPQGGEVDGVIAAFEQIVAAMPNDRSSLEALIHAYEEGDHLDKAAEYQARLGNVLFEDADIPALREWLANAESYTTTYPDIRELVDKIGEEMPATKVVEEVVPPPVQDPGIAAESVDRTFDMQAELAFAWDMMQAEQLTQAEYASVVQDLADMSVGGVVQTVSLLHALEARGHKGFERIIASASKEYGVPFVSLDCVEIPSAVATLLPVDFVVNRGALPFDMVGSEALVAVMNPKEEQLHKDIETLLGRKAHLFLTLPSEFDRALTRMSDVKTQ